MRFLKARTPWAAIVGLLCTTACNSTDESVADSSSSPDVTCEATGRFPDRPTYDEWIPVELDGAVCGDGSPYKFFVKYVKDSTDLGITLEPGGACWDYLTCSGQGPGVLGALSLGPIDDDHMSALPPPLGTKEGAIPWGLVYPHFGESDGDVPTADFNQVYFPYCTGDAYAGDLSAIYMNEDEAEGVSVEHRGRANLEAAVDWLEEEFGGAGHLHVMGSSAGGLGAMLNYALLRDAVDPACASLINDSSPIFPGDGPQAAARQAYRERWDLDELVADLDDRLGGAEPQGEGGASGVWTPDSPSIRDDMGHLTRLLSETFPSDRFLVTFFARDLNNTQFSYLSGDDDLSSEELFELWDQDTDLLVEEIDGLENWGYFIPFFRPDNCSHCVALVPLNELEDAAYIASLLSSTADGYLRTDLELQTGGAVDFRDAFFQMLDPTKSLPHERALPIEGVGFTDEELAACLGD